MERETKSAASSFKIIDITRNPKYEKFLYKCLAPMPFRRYTSRREYLQKTVRRGFHKKLVLSDKDVVGQIEYAPTEVSGYPIRGRNIIVMNCIWVLRRAKGHNLGRLLIEDMIRSEGNAAGFATIALENHWSPWFRKEHMEKLGFRSVDSISVSHRTKHPETVFKIHLMWMPVRDDAEFPVWNRRELLRGEVFCLAHPLYRPQAWKGSVFEQR